MEDTDGIDIDVEAMSEDAYLDYLAAVPPRPESAELDEPSRSFPPPSVFDAQADPDVVADFALGQGPRPDVLPVLITAIETGRLSESGRADALAAVHRYHALLHAVEARLMSDMDHADDSGKEFVREDIATALRISPLTAQNRLSQARTLTGRFPDSVKRLEAGDITPLHARVLIEATDQLPDDDARIVEPMVLPTAAEQTVGQFKKAVAKAVLQVDATPAEQRHALAVKDRRVAFRAVSDGMAELFAYLPLDQAAAAKTNLDALATQSIGPEDERTADQRRADVLCDLLTGREQETPGDLPREHGLRPAVQVTVSLETLAGASEQPGELDGFGPIPAWLARHLAADPTGTWRRLVTDPTGKLLDYGRNTYRPPAELQQYVIARDRTCCFPGCQRPARKCDQDHRVAWDDGGHTNPTNLYSLCPRHHALKHETDWRYEPLPDGDLLWTSPTGRQHIRRAANYPTGPPPPEEPPPF